MRNAAIAFNSLTAVYWVLVGALLYSVTHDKTPLVFLAFAALRSLTVYGLAKRTWWAYQRSLRTNLAGAVISGLFAFGLGNVYFFPLIGLEVAAAFFTFKSKNDLPHGP